MSSAICPICGCGNENGGHYDWGRNACRSCVGEGWASWDDFEGDGVQVTVREFAQLIASARTENRSGTDGERRQ